MHKVADRLRPFGTTIFAEMTRLAREHHAVNLSQGFPDFDGPDFVEDAAVQALRSGHNQYARFIGEPVLNEAIARRWRRLTSSRGGPGREFDDGDAGTATADGMAIDPDRNVLVTSGCTEAIAAVCLGLINPGDEVILFEPYYDSYRPCLAMAGATPRFVALRAPDFTFEVAELQAAITPRTRAIFINTPHNPTGKVFTRAELETIAALCARHDLLAVTDEVYEHLVFEGAEHVRLATLPGMFERTVTLSSLGKSFSLTGWKIGWAIGEAELITAVRCAHQFLTYASATPLQHAAAVALDAPQSYFDQYLAEYTERRDFLCGALEDLGFEVHRPAGTYFVLADHRPFGFDDDVTFCRHLTTRIGVAAIPPTAFYEHRDLGRHLVRFAFCKQMQTLKEAVARLQRLRAR